MGSCKSKNNSTINSNTDNEKKSQLYTIEEKSPLDYTGDIGIYKLCKKRKGCSGMFWRSDPSGRTQLLSNKNWPRDNCLIKGELCYQDNIKFLYAFKVKQHTAGNNNNNNNNVNNNYSFDDDSNDDIDSGWIDAPDGAYLPFEYDNHYYLEKVDNDHNNNSNGHNYNNDHDGNDDYSHNEYEYLQ